MAAQNYQDLIEHQGHKVSIYTYQNENVAVECEDCFQVLVDFDNERVNN